MKVKNFLIAAILVLVLSSMLFADEEENACMQTAKSLLNACQLKASTNFWITKAKCLNISDE